MLLFQSPTFAEDSYQTKWSKTPIDVDAFKAMILTHEGNAQTLEKILSHAIRQYGLEVIILNDVSNPKEVNLELQKFETDRIKKLNLDDKNAYLKNRKYFTNLIKQMNASDSPNAHMAGKFIRPHSHFQFDDLTHSFKPEAYKRPLINTPLILLSRHKRVGRYVVVHELVHVFLYLSKKDAGTFKTVMLAAPSGKRILHIAKENTRIQMSYLEARIREFEIMFRKGDRRTEFLRDWMISQLAHTSMLFTGVRSSYGEELEVERFLLENRAEFKLKSLKIYYFAVNVKKIYTLLNEISHLLTDFSETTKYPQFNDLNPEVQYQVNKFNELAKLLNKESDWGASIKKELENQE